MSDEEVINYLTQIKGVGKWTAEMLLMFALGHEDIFSIDDLGLQNAMINIYKLDREDKKAFREKLLSISAKWSPLPHLRLPASLALERQSFTEIIKKSRYCYRDFFYNQVISILHRFLYHYCPGEIIMPGIVGENSNDRFKRNDPAKAAQDGILPGERSAVFPQGHGACYQFADSSSIHHLLTNSIIPQEKTNLYKVDSDYNSQRKANIRRTASHIRNVGSK